MKVYKVTLTTFVEVKGDEVPDIQVIVGGEDVDFDIDSEEVED